VVKEADDRTLLTLALIENLQRDDLSAIEEAAGYQRLSDEFKLGQNEIARLVGRDRSTVANLLRLLKLPAAIKALVQEKKLTEGHARALLSISDEPEMMRLASVAVDEGWSVRELENRTRNGSSAAAAANTRGSQAGKAARKAEATADARRVEDALRKRLGTDVRVTTRRQGRGFISISYYSNDDLARVLELILGQPFAG
jgi:ParB family chromosome partitioning protein